MRQPDNRELHERCPASSILDQPHPKGTFTKMEVRPLPKFPIEPDKVIYGPPISPAKFSLRMEYMDDSPLQRQCPLPSPVKSLPDLYMEKVFRNFGLSPNSFADSSTPAGRKFTSKESRLQPESQRSIVSLRHQAINLYLYLIPAISPGSQQTRLNHESRKTLASWPQ